jgi:hypothetical protein
MPSLNVHLHFAIKVISKKQDNHPLGFLYGSIAPDCFIKTVRGNFAKSHFINKEDGILLTKFKLVSNELNMTPQSDINSFNNGYYGHLWLDNYFSKNQNILMVDEAGNIYDTNKQEIIKAEIDGVASKILLENRNTIEFAPFKILLPKGFSFIDTPEMERKLWKYFYEDKAEIIEPSIINKNEYENLINLLTKEFIDEI